MLYTAGTTERQVRINRYIVGCKYSTNRIKFVVINELIDT